MDKLKVPVIFLEWGFDPNLSKEDKQFYQKAAAKGIVGIAYAFPALDKNTFDGTMEDIDDRPDCVIIPIELNDEKMERTHSGIARIALYGDDRDDHPMITLTEDCYQAIKDKASSEFCIYHELGHYFCGHLTSENTEGYRKARTDAIKNHTVFWQEEMADAFATHYVSGDLIAAELDDRNAYFSALHYSSAIDEDDFQMMTSEYTYRSSAVRAYCGLN